MKVAARRREEVAVDGCKLEIPSPTVLRRLDLPTPTSLRPARPVVFTRFLIISPGLPSAHKDKGARPGKRRSAWPLSARKETRRGDVLTRLL